MTNQLFSIFKNNLRRQRKSAPGNSYSRSHRRGWPRSEESCHYYYHWLCSDTTNNFYLGDLGRNPRDFLQVWLRGGERNDREDNQQERWQVRQPSKYWDQLWLEYDECEASCYLWSRSRILLWRYQSNNWEWQEEVECSVFIIITTQQTSVSLWSTPAKTVTSWFLSH